MDEKTSPPAAFELRLSSPTAVPSARADAGGRFELESLETRVLFTAWGGFVQLVAQNNKIAHFPTIVGKGESVAVIDTGINYKDPLLGGGFGRGHKVVAGRDFVDNDSDPLDTFGHGTAIAGLIGSNSFIYQNHRYQGLAPSAQLVALRVDDGVNDVPPSRIRAALQWVITNRARYNIVAVNMSEGNGDFYPQKTSEDDYGDLLATLLDDNVFIAASSGNSGDSFGVEYPSADPNVISVGAVNLQDTISDFTSTGPDLDLLAPGENVPVLWVANGRPQIVLQSGTSFAAPYAAGTAALMRQLEPDATPYTLLTQLQSTGKSDQDPESGAFFTRLNVDKAVNAAYNVYRQSLARSRVVAVPGATSPAASSHFIAKAPVPAGTFYSPSAPGIFSAPARHDGFNFDDWESIRKDDCPAEMSEFDGRANVFPDRL